LGDGLSVVVMMALSFVARNFFSPETPAWIGGRHHLGRCSVPIRPDRAATPGGTRTSAEAAATHGITKLNIKFRK
jgi:hypothetical protein